jgi:hypothetical protein
MKNKKLFSLFLLVFLFGLVSFVAYSNMSRWCPSDHCNGNHCWCDGDYIEELGPCCFTCWKWYPWGCSPPGCWYLAIYECCGPGNCEEIYP